MWILLKNSLISFKKRFLQYLGLIALLTMSISIFSALFANVSQMNNKYNLLYLDSAKETHFITNESIQSLELLDDSEIIDPDLFDTVYQNNNTELIKALKKQEQNDFKCVNSENDPSWIDPLLCSVHKILFVNNTDKNHLTTQANSIKIWRILKATNFEVDDNFSINSALNISGEISNGKNTFIIVPNVEVKPTGIFNNVSKLKLVKGRLPVTSTEIVISETYAYNNNIKVNDNFVIKEMQFKIVGIGNSYPTRRLRKSSFIATLFPEPLSARDNGVIFMTSDALSNDILKSKMVNGFQNPGILLNINGNVENALATVTQNLNKKMLTENTNENWIRPSFDQTISNLQIQTIVFSVLVIVIMGSIVLIVSLFIRKEIAIQQTTIGNLKAFGYKSWQIAFNFIGTIFIMTVISSLLAFATSLLFQREFFSGIMRVLNVGIVSYYFDPFIIVMFFFVLPLIFTFVCFLLITYLLRVPALGLLYPKTSNNSYRVLRAVKTLFNRSSFEVRLSIAFFAKSFTKWMISAVVLLLTSFILFLQYLTFDTINHKIDSYGSEWNSTGSVVYSHQYRNETDIDQFADVVDPSQPAKKAYLYNQQFEYVAIQEIDFSKNDMINFKYKMLDLETETNAFNPDEIKNSIYRVFSSSENLILNEIFIEVHKLLNETPTFEPLQLFAMLHENHQAKLLSWFARFQQINENISQKFKINISNETIRIFLNNEDTIIKLKNKFENSNNSNLSEIFKFINNIEQFKALNVNIDNLEVTLNYVAYDNTQDYLMGQYSYAFKNSPEVTKTNRLVQGSVYGIQKSALEKMLNIKNPSQYLEKLYFNDLSKFNSSKRELPVLISRTAAEYKDNNFKVGDIVKLDKLFWIGPINVKIVGIIDNAINEWSMVTNQNLIDKYISLRQTTQQEIDNKPVYNYIETDEGNNFFLNNKFSNFIMSSGEQIQPLRSLAFYYEQKGAPIVTRRSFRQDGRLPILIPDENNNSNLPIKPTINSSGIFIKSIAKETIAELLSTFSNILSIVRYGTIATVVIALILLVSMIIDDNIYIIATMKILGYRIREIVALIIGWYLAITIIFFGFGIGLSYLVWYIVGKAIFNLTGLIYISYITPLSLLITIGIVLAIMVITYIISISIIKRKDILVLQKTV